MYNIRQRSAIFALGVALLWGSILGGCDTVKAPYSGGADAVPIENYPRITAEKSVRKGLVFGPATVEEGSSQSPLRVTVPIRSIVDRHPVSIQYRFEFFDGAGRPLGRTADQSWRYKELSPRTQTFLDANALDTHAADWRLVVRSAK